MNPKLITTFVVLISALFVGFFFAFPKFGKVQSLRDDLAEANQALEEMLEKVNVTKMAITDFEGLREEQIELVQDALPQDVDLPNLFILLEFIISSSGLTSESINVQVLESDIGTSLNLGTGEELDSRPTKGLESAMVNISLRGNYASFKAFLATLEKSLRIFDVESISFASPKQTKEGVESFRFSLILKTYFSE